MKQKLTLHRETVRTLSDEQLVEVNGMSGQTCYNTICCCNTSQPPPPTASIRVCCF